MLPAGAGIVSQRIGKGGFWGAQGSSRDSAATRPRARLHRRARRERECGRARAQTARARPRGAAGEVALYGKLKQLHAVLVCARFGGGGQLEKLYDSWRSILYL